MQGSTWDSGGKEIFHLPLSQLNKISVRLDGLSSTLEALVFLWWYQSSNIKICLEDMWYQFFSMGQRIGFSQRASWSIVAGVFQGELAKTSPEIAWTPISKLGFLVRLLKKDEDLGSLVVLLLRDDFNKSCLVRECRELEDAFGTSQVRSKGNVGGRETN